MKQKFSLICIVMMTFLLTPLLSTYGISYGLGESFDGIDNYESLYENSSFTDIKTHFARKPIIKMSALSVLRGMGNHKFYPNHKLTKEQAVVFIVRLLGLEDESQIVGEKLTKEMDTGAYRFKSPQDDWLEGYLKVAQSKSIITREEVKKIVELSDEQKDKIEEKLAKKMLVYDQNRNLTDEQIENIEKSIRKNLERSYTWGQAANREEIALWVGRMLQITPINGEPQQRIYTMKDWKSMKTADIPIIEAILQKGIMTKNSKGYFSPKATVTRGQMAAILDKASEEILKKRGYKTLSGTVEEIENYVTSEQDMITRDLYGVENRIITINNDDGSYTEITAKKSSINDLNKGFSVYKYGILGLPKDIQVDDYVKYFINAEGKIVFVEVE
ncbi:S-layer homology domain-containing protein [Crassaminicella profunda]|uniref:S-layer homology domain-containing protein n=1 Tax=Crassaminicella profunda TaxID=1286698 RepID=UPI001CA6D76A|nr:S-layer homology domain-containing protein [Crassaminicella profunda]QZY55480.1 S-layer homology domain-containing protein [Crassaminicella profunda]